MKNDKLRVIKDFQKLDENIQQQIKLAHPHGFNQYLIRFTNKEGKLVSALPFETDDKYYLVRMTNVEAKQIVEDDKDYDDDGNLKEEIKDEYGDKYSDLDYISNYYGDSEGDDDDDDDLKDD